MGKVIGSRMPRVDALSKVLGKFKFADDYKFPDELVGYVVMAGVPHAKILKIDVSEAEKIPGVHAILTAKDVPGENMLQVTIPDHPLIVDKYVRQESDTIALIAADSKEIAKEAAKKIVFEYKELPIVNTIDEALSEDAPAIHPQIDNLPKNINCHLKIRKGNIEKGFEEADFVIEDDFYIQHQEHAYLEPNGTTAVPQDDGSIYVYSTMQCPFYVQEDVAKNCGLPLSKVRAIQTGTGGGFGGKEDFPSDPASCAALLAQKTQKPVKIIYDRETDMKKSTKRHPMKVHMKYGCKNDGTLTAAEIKVYADSGAYVGLTPVVLYRTTVHAAGPYEIPNVKVDTYGVYTNKVYTGAYRGFGTPQVVFAAENIMDMIARKLNMDPIDLRLKNALDIGKKTITGFELKESVGLVDALKKAKEVKEKWLSSKEEIPKHFKRGIGVSAFFYGVGLGARGWFLDGAGSYVQLLKDGSVRIYIGNTEMGQGALTVMTEIAMEKLGLPAEMIKINQVDTDLVPDSGPTVASRTTVLSGNATIIAIDKIITELRDFLIKKYNLSDKSEIKFNDQKIYIGDKILDFYKEVADAYVNNLNLAAEGWYKAPKSTFDDETGQGSGYFAYSWGVDLCKVHTNPHTGEVSVKNIAAIVDAGTIINKMSAEGQLEGGIVQGMGYALTENFVVKNGKLLSDNFNNYTIPTIMDMPEIETYFVEKPYSGGPFGAKGIGEPSLIPVAGAIATAVADSLDGKHLHKNPILPEDIVKVANEK